MRITEGLTDRFDFIVGMDRACITFLEATVNLHIIGFTALHVYFLLNLSTRAILVMMSAANNPIIKMLTIGGMNPSFLVIASNRP